MLGDLEDDEDVLEDELETFFFVFLHHVADFYVVFKVFLEQKSAPFFEIQISVFFKFDFLPEKGSFVNSHKVVEMDDSIITNILRGVFNI